MKIVWWIAKWFATLSNITYFWFNSWSQSTSFVQEKIQSPLSLGKVEPYLMKVIYNKTSIRLKVRVIPLYNSSPILFLYIFRRWSLLINVQLSAFKTIFWSLSSITCSPEYK